MFTPFLYCLRRYGLHTTLTEWTVFLRALELGLHRNSLLDFYYLARTVLVKKETDYDRFDQAFSAFFQHMENPRELPPEFQEWLAQASSPTPFDKEMTALTWGRFSREGIQQLMEERLKQQKEAHHGGTTWIGTGGQTAFGHSGYAPKGIRVYGESRQHRALAVAGERRFADFRDDSILEIRQFQMSLRKLRRLSDQENIPKTELDVKGTISATSQKGGFLDIVLKRPRKNRTKLLLLMDSGGSMWPYMDLSRRLFQAVSQGSPFKELKIYYFHNIFYDQLFTSPDCAWEHRISTQWVFQQCPPEYKVILVGDARMGEEELMAVNGNIEYKRGNDRPGIAWLEELLQRYPAVVWLNPVEKDYWHFYYSTARILEKGVSMFPLTLKGLEESIEHLRKTGA